jgi:phosphate:Na+ symporter
VTGTFTLINLLGGIALLLWGLRMVRTGMTRAWGRELQKVLKWSLSNRFKAFLSGLGVTVLLQSSTATSLLTSSFAGRGFVAVAPGLAVLLGADVGTTIVAQILSFDLSLLSPVLLFGGLVLFSVAEKSRLKNLGRMVFGLGLMLLALTMIVAASAPLRASGGAQLLMTSLTGEPILAVLVGAILTAIAHSSLATVLLVISLSATGFIPLDVAFALVLGANLGGALPPVMATMNADVAARRPPLGNFLFRLTGVILVLPFIQLVGVWLAGFDSDTTRQVANFHTVFNLALAVVFLPLIGGMETLTIKLLPDPPKPAENEEHKPLYLDRRALDTPQVALTNAVRETVRMGDVLQTMYRDMFAAMLANDRVLIKRVIALDDVVDEFYLSIKRYLTELSRETLGDEDSRRCTDIMTFITNLEHIGDIIVMNVAELSQRKAKKDISISKGDRRDITDLVDRIEANLRLSFNVFLSGDPASARVLLESKQELRQQERTAIDDHMERLREGKSVEGDASALYLDLLRDLRRINSHLTSVAYPILENAGELYSSRLRDLDD